MLVRLFDQLLAAVDDGDDVAEVAAAEEVAVPRPLNASILVASRYGGETVRMVAPEGSSPASACGTAVPCQRLSKPRIKGSEGMASRIRPPGCRRRWKTDPPSPVEI
jgi:hypothetical protein